MIGRENLSGFHGRGWGQGGPIDLTVPGKGWVTHAMDANDRPPAAAPTTDELIGALRRFFEESGQRFGLDGEADVERALRQHQKLEALGRMASEVAHDFSNLLTVILGYAELLELSLGDEAGQAGDYLGEVRRAAQKASALTSQLLTFGRDSRVILAPLDLGELVRGLGTMLRPLLRNNVEMVTLVDAAAGRVRADPRQVEQVVVNLVVNARDALVNGGRIEVSVAAADFDEPLEHAHGTLPAGPYTRMTVCDNGRGMDATTLVNLFRPFFTTKGHGTGLGLAIVARIVRQAGGQVVVRSTPGVGTIVDVYLPRLASGASLN